MTGSLFDWRKNMQIGIDLENYASPMEDIENIINDYGKNREIGYLKINPERLPVIVSEDKALADIERYGVHKETYTVMNGKFEMITDSRAVSKIGSDIALCGNAYTVKRQREAFAALDIEEILEWLLFLCRYDYEAAVKGDEARYGTYLFVFDKERGYWA